jgi:phosphopentomutase
MTPITRVIVIVLDGVGIGEAPDAADYGDVGSNSIGNTARVLGGIDLPNMGAIGVGNVTPITGVPPRATTTGAYGKLRPRSHGKDTVTGHWELMGIYLPEPFPTYPNGFPPDVIAEFTRLTGKKALGNKAASGTDILRELGMEHMRTGDPIVYTSADSVFQIAAHEEIIPIDEQYRICEIARKMLTGQHGVGRVIARPFVGTNPDNFSRTSRRRDFARVPDEPTVLDRLVGAGKQVYSVGKIDDIFGHRGITKGNHTTNNADGIQAMLDFLHEDFEGLMFINLIEFDMIYGHRNDVKGYGAALKAFDDSIPEIRKRMKSGDIAIITGDHGVDPTTSSTDHSREHVPCLVFGEPVKSGDLGTRGSFADVGATIAEIFGLGTLSIGESFLRQISR